MKNIKRIFCLGMSAPEVVCEIVKANPEIKALLFKKYIPIENLEEESVIRIQNQEEEVIRIQASLKRMILHNPPESEEEIWLSRKDITPEHLNQISEPWNQQFALAVISKIGPSGSREVRHIPMMDFSCEASSENLEKIQGFLKRIGQKGVVLFSGRSYHFYGINLFSNKNWSNFLGQCLLFTGYTDSRHIGHRLIDGYGSLRISKEVRRPTLPTVVAIT